MRDQTKVTKGKQKKANKSSLSPQPPFDFPVPKTLKQARVGGYWEGFEKAIETEISTLEETDTWGYIDKTSLPRGTNILRSKFVFDIKRGANGEFLKYKARMVAMGFTQIHGVDFFDTFASVLTSKSFRILLSIHNNRNDTHMEHWDIKSAFVNAPINEDIYVYQVPGFERPNTEGKVLKLKKALYGTKQAAHAWQQHLSSIFLSLGAKKNKKDECVYMWHAHDSFLFIGTHVDDFFCLYNEKAKTIRDKVMNTLQNTMEVTDKGEIAHALDMRIERCRDWENENLAENLHRLAAE
jgi:hypothetical protein